MCISFAFVHKVLHWPGASCLILSSVFICLLTVICLVILGIKEKDSEKKFSNNIFAILLLAGFTIAIYPVFMGANQGYLNSFVRIANQYNAQADTLQANLSNLNQAIELKKNFYPELVKPYFEKVKEVESASDSLIAYIKDLRSILISKTEEIDKTCADTLHLELIKRKDDSNLSGEMFLGPEIDGKAGYASELKAKLGKYRELLLKYSEKPNDKFSIGLLTPDSKVEDKNCSWEIFTFYHRNLVQNVATLNRLIVEIIQAEYTFVNKQFNDSNDRIIGYLYEKLRKANIKVEDKNAVPDVIVK
jgi:hypothetical protein